MNLELLNLDLLKTLPLPEAGGGGALLLLAEDPLRAGETLLAARGALRAGCRDVSIVAASDGATHLALALPEATILPLPQSEGKKARQLLHDSAPAFAAGVLDLSYPAKDGASGGALDAPFDAMGLCLNGGTLDALPDSFVLPALKKRDAGRATILVLIAGSDEEKIAGALRDLAPDVPVVALSKTVLVASGGKIYKSEEEKGAESKPKPPGALSGSDAVLCGVIGGLLSRGVSSHTAALWGAHLYNLASEAATEDLGEDSVTVRDIVERLAGAMRYLRRASAPKKESAPAGLRRL